MINLTQEFTLTQTISCSAAQLYQAFTTAKGWCKWCCESAETEAIVGGNLHIYTEGYNACGEFIELEEYRSIAFTWLGDNEPPTRIHVSLTEKNSSTVVAFTVTILENEQEWPGFAKFLERTWGRALDNLKANYEDPDISR